MGRDQLIALLILVPCLCCGVVTTAWAEDCPPFDDAALAVIATITNPGEDSIELDVKRVVFGPSNPGERISIVPALPTTANPGGTLYVLRRASTEEGTGEDPCVFVEVEDPDLFVVATGEMWRQGDTSYEPRAMVLMRSGPPEFAEALVSQDYIRDIRSTDIFIDVAYRDDVAWTARQRAIAVLTRDGDRDTIGELRALRKSVCSPASADACEQLRESINQTITAIRGGRVAVAARANYQPSAGHVVLGVMALPGAIPSWIGTGSLQTATSDAGQAVAATALGPLRAVGVLQSITLATNLSLGLLPVNHTPLSRRLSLLGTFLFDLGSALVALEAHYRLLNSGLDHSAMPYGVARSTTAIVGVYLLIKSLFEIIPAVGPWHLLQFLSSVAERSHRGPRWSLLPAGGGGTLMVRF